MFKNWAQWHAFVNTVTNLRIPYNAKNVPSFFENVHFSRRTAKHLQSCYENVHFSRTAAKHGPSYLKYVFFILRQLTECGLSNRVTIFVHV
jgi:hypothetical protein